MADVTRIAGSSLIPALPTPILPPISQYDPSGGGDNCPCGSVTQASDNEIDTPFEIICLPCGWGGGGPVGGLGPNMGGGGGSYNPFDLGGEGLPGVDPTQEAINLLIKLINSKWTPASKGAKWVNWFLGKYADDTSDEGPGTISDILAILSALSKIGDLAGLAGVTADEAVGSLLEALSAGAISFEAVTAILSLCLTPGGLEGFILIAGAILLAVAMVKAGSYLAQIFVAAMNTMIDTYSDAISSDLRQLYQFMLKQ